MINIKKINDFKRQFNFDHNLEGYIGVEVEFFILNEEGSIVPRAKEILEHLNDPKHFSFELSACQIETRVGPIKIKNLKKALSKNENKIRQAETMLNFRRSYKVAPSDMPLDIYPHKRYKKIVAQLSEEEILAGARIIGVHIHIGMPDHETALKRYNATLPFLDELCELGDESMGLRLKIYKKIAKYWAPIPYLSWEDFCADAIRKNFFHDPRRNWALIRISTHGTIEFRMFGSTPYYDKIIEWAKKCLKICGY